VLGQTLGGVNKHEFHIMRATGTWVFSLLLLALATFTTAWPWPRWLPELESLVVRQENNNQQSTW
jgi:hypothetical protein